MCDPVRMTATLRSDFDEFLYASIGEDSSGAPVSLLTALARLDVDAWEEAAVLARLSPDAASQKLAALLMALPDGPKTEEAATIAARLVPLLHRAPVQKIRSAAPPPPGAAALLAGKFTPLILRIVALIAVIILITFIAWG